MAGIYIHIPFCKHKCTYCDFHFSTTFEEYRQEMIDSICQEIELRHEYLAGKEIKTIYFGGGTPSILLESELKQIIKTISTQFEINSRAEVTFEANPDDINEEALILWKSVGVNRLSIGLQSFKQSDLDWMNRAHNVEESLNCVQLAQKHGFDNLTVDLMYGLPDLNMSEWSNHIQKVIDMGVPHISAYCLTIEEKTALSNWVNRGKISTPNEDVQSDQFMMLLETLESNGFEQYEISNFSSPGHESKHNSNYWKGEWYLGVGPSAHSFNGTSRSWNITNNQKYIRAVKVKSEIFETEFLSKLDQFNERILIGLRTIYGVKRTELNDILPISSGFESVLRGFKGKGWIQEKGNVLTLTKEGKLRADFIASELFID